MQFFFLFAATAAAAAVAQWHTNQLALLSLNFFSLDPSPFAPWHLFLEMFGSDTGYWPPSSLQLIDAWFPCRTLPEINANDMHSRKLNLIRVNSSNNNNNRNSKQHRAPQPTTRNWNGTHSGLSHFLVILVTFHIMVGAFDCIELLIMTFFFPNATWAV